MRLPFRPVLRAAPLLVMFPSACAPFGGAETRAGLDGGLAGVDGGVAGVDGGVDAAADSLVRDVDRGFTGCDGAVMCDRYVFVTSATFRGDFGGIGLADEACQSAANASPVPAIKGRRFLAWLSVDKDAA